MAVPGDAIENPISGERVVFRQMANDSDSEALTFDLFFAPNRPAPVAHIHSRQEEVFEVVAGHVRYRLAGVEKDLAAGESALLPAGIPHTLWNSGDEEARLVVEVRPALKTAVGMETIFGLARDGKLSRSGAPNPLQGVLLAREYDTFLASPPLGVQRIGSALLAPLARLLGYKARYNEYSGAP